MIFEVEIPAKFIVTVTAKNEKDARLKAKQLAIKNDIVEVENDEIVCARFYANSDESAYSVYRSHLR